MKCVIGIDPGASGALCLISEDRSRIEILRIKSRGWAASAALVMGWNQQYEIVFSGIEHVHAHTRDDKKTIFTFGENTGRVKGWFDVINKELTPIESQNWLRHFSLYGLRSKFMAAGMSEGKARTAAKQQYVLKAETVFKPEMARIRVADIRGPNHVTSDMADAMLIAQYLWDITFSGGRRHVVKKFCAACEYDISFGKHTCDIFSGVKTNTDRRN